MTSVCRNILGSSFLSRRWFQVFLDRAKHALINLYLCCLFKRVIMFEQYRCLIVLNAAVGYVSRQRKLRLSHSDIWMEDYCWHNGCAHLYFWNPISSACSLNVLLDMLMPYFLMRPCLAPVTLQPRESLPIFLGWLRSCFFIPAVPSMYWPLPAIVFFKSMLYICLSLINE